MQWQLQWYFTLYFILCADYWIRIFYFMNLLNKYLFHIPNFVYWMYLNCCFIYMVFLFLYFSQNSEIQFIKKTGVKPLTILSLHVVMQTTHLFRPMKRKVMTGEDNLVKNRAQWLKSRQNFEVITTVCVWWDLTKVYFPEAMKANRNKFRLTSHIA